ncbi:hypothetical protein RIF29_13873 [Crotalaria pallida]|uniref:Legume lectin domain-containing protein n=1 Tax=Crotalaria pallida TaxID=3830 RepID=A0AAN9FGH9_CROPI
MSTFSKPKPTRVLFATFITLFFFLLLNIVNSSDDLSFYFKTFKPSGKDLIIQGNASVSLEGVLRLTQVKKGQPIAWSVGKVLYAAPVHIWDGDRVASFVTSFDFRMLAPNQKLVSDGFTFFLAPPNLPMGRNGGYLALFNDSKCDSSYQIVAVEFDTHGSPDNPWDPDYQHVGININCLKSDRLTRWDARYGAEVTNVEIRYDGSTKTLTAALTYPSDKNSIIVSGGVDLKAILPEWVTVGFTATTADTFRETHDVLNWKFDSTLETNNNVGLESKGHDTA